MGQAQSTLDSFLKQPAPSPLPQVNDDASNTSACPVDHHARDAYLRASQRQGRLPPHHEAISVGNTRTSRHQLSTEREISTIPRAFPPSSNPSSSSIQPGATGVPARQSAQASASHSLASPNAETEIGRDPNTSASGHWVYPSESMFYNAMKRKNYDPHTQDMSSIIPIHNAVNERTWYEILRWEKPYAGSAATSTGPKLVSFSGDSTKLTPRARWNSFLGYERPFDRHDWVVQRGDAQGTTVDYVIDFYAGKQTSNAGDKKALGPSFYLDVRPKLNSLEGYKMRMSKFLGLA